MLRAVAPHRFAFDEFAAEYRPLQFHPLRQKRIGVPQARNSLEQGALRWRQEGHRLGGIRLRLVHPSEARTCPSSELRSNAQGGALCHKCTSCTVSYTPL